MSPENTPEDRAARAQVDYAIKTLRQLENQNAPRLDQEVARKYTRKSIIYAIRHGVDLRKKN